jgi:hypothetical protein
MTRPSKHYEHIRLSSQAFHLIWDATVKSRTVLNTRAWRHFTRQVFIILTLRTCNIIKINLLYTIYMIKNTPWKVGFLQALGLTLYVTIFALIIQAFSGTTFNPSPFFSILIFLLTFIISATICGSITLIYPFVLFFSNKKKEALHVIMWNVGWLLLFFLIFLGVVLVLK